MSSNGIYVFGFATQKQPALYLEYAKLLATLHERYMEFAVLTFLHWHATRVARAYHAVSMTAPGCHHRFTKVWHYTPMIALWSLGVYRNTHTVPAISVGMDSNEETNRTFPLILLPVFVRNRPCVYIIEQLHQKNTANQINRRAQDQHLVFKQCPRRSLGIGSVGCM